MTKLISLREHLSAKTGLPVDDVDNLIYAFLQTLIDNLRQKVDVIDLYPLMRFTRFKRFPTKISDIEELMAMMHQYDKCEKKKTEPGLDILDKIMGGKYLSEYYVTIKKSELDKLQIKVNKRRKKGKLTLPPVELEPPKVIVYV